MCSWESWRSSHIDIRARTQWVSEESMDTGLQTCRSEVLVVSCAKEDRKGQRVTRAFLTGPGASLESISQLFRDYSWKWLKLQRLGPERPPWRFVHTPLTLQPTPAKFQQVHSFQKPVQSSTQPKEGTDAGGGPCLARDDDLTMELQKH
ncbi:hypothetical protein STEG23_008876 [Scotinomys teguina]